VPFLQAESVNCGASWRPLGRNFRRTRKAQAENQSAWRWGLATKKSPAHRCTEREIWEDGDDSRFLSQIRGEAQECMLTWNNGLLMAFRYGW